MRAQLGKAGVAMGKDVGGGFVCVSTFEQAVNHLNKTYSCVMMVPSDSADYIVPRIHHSDNLQKIVVYGSDKLGLDLD